MAIEIDYVSQFSYQLYDATGTLDDYIYGGLGAYAYTPEIGKVNFHRNCVDGFIPENVGREIEDFDAGEGNGPLPPRPPGGVHAAAEAALSGDSRSILRGDAPAGRTLRLAKRVAIGTEPACRTTTASMTRT